MSEWISRNMPTGFEVEYFFLIPALLGQLTVVIAQRIFRITVNRGFASLGRAKKSAAASNTAEICASQPWLVSRKTMVLTGFYQGFSINRVQTAVSERLQINDWNILHGSLRYSTG